MIWGLGDALQPVTGSHEEPEGKKQALLGQIKVVFYVLSQSHSKHRVMGATSRTDSCTELTSK